jgi:threonyl-tRNA synthetase
METTMITDKHEVAYEDSPLYRVRHSAAHILAQAVLQIFPEALLGIGPPIADGFYYDFGLPRPLAPKDLREIEERMKEIIRQGQAFSRSEIQPEEARRQFAQQPYKLELINDILDGQPNEDGQSVDVDHQPSLGVYRNGPFSDLCRGPHVASTDDIDPDAVRLLNIAGAYWRGDCKRPMLQRIYGTAWESRGDLEAYLHNVDEAKRRDHRAIGRTLDLFSTSDDVGPGLILWHPKGAMIRYLAERFSQEAHLVNDYEWVYTPHIGRANLWQRSGHLDFYKDSMYSPLEIENEQYYLKPMNCPFHVQIYNTETRSYKDLPKRYAEFGTVYRYELSGVVQGLTRVRGFTQDDAHVFCLPEQIEVEIHRALKFSLYILRTFGLNDFKAYIATRPDNKAIGSPADWEMATATLRSAVEKEGIDFDYDDGGGAFYGPKIDLKVVDALGREWQLSTIQFDFNLPERFGLEYVGKDGQRHRPFMVHRALWGSAERFLGMLIEHYKGAFPFWIAPVQVILIPITDRHVAYARHVAEQLASLKMRVRVDDRSERMNAKIRNAEIQKIPYLLIVGDRELATETLSVRSREGGGTTSMTVDEFISVTAAARQAGEPMHIRF